MLSSCWYKIPSAARFSSAFGSVSLVSSKSAIAFCALFAPVAATEARNSVFASSILYSSMILLYSAYAF